jgi:hypothetical protein
MKNTAIKLLQEYIADSGPDDPSTPPNIALLAALESDGDLTPHKETLYGLSPCNWSFDEIYTTLEISSKPKNRS